MRNAIPNRLVVSYILDWILIIIIAVIGHIWSKTTPKQHSFTLTDPSISFPHTKHETVPLNVAMVVAVIFPATIIILVVLVQIPGSTVDRNVSRSVTWRYKIWEWNAGWLGLAVAVTGAWAAAKGLKILYGKPRPDMLARCHPDLSNIAAYAVGGLGQELAGAPITVTWEICQNQSDILKINGFISFPSDHSSLSFAGLTYLSLWLCSKFSVAFPYLAKFPFSHRGPRDEEQASAAEESCFHSESAAHHSLSVREEGAAPPIYMLIVAAAPIAVACFISASRWFDNQHHGFDILFGCAMGIFFAWIGFRLYNLPIRRGAGWSWGTRSRKHAFFRGVGFPSRVGDDNWASGRVESGGLALG